MRTWHAARASSGNVPGPGRVQRVREKLADPASHLVVVKRHGDTVGMALSEPFRERLGTGDVRAHWGHVSMVFVSPAHQGGGVGRSLMQQLITAGPWRHLSVWTREANVRAHRLYQHSGFVATGEFGSLSGEVVQRWERLVP